MTIRPDRKRFWRPWRKRFPRLLVVVAGANMVTLLLAAVDWRPLQAVHLDWLVVIALVLLAVLWVGIVVTALALALIVAALRVEQISLDEGRIRRRQVFDRRMDVPVEGASVTRGKSLDTVLAPGANKPLLAPHIFYSPEDLDQLWSAAGIEVAPPPQG